MSAADPEARVMKMADGGFRPAFNAQLAVDVQTHIITGLDITNVGSDMGLMRPMHEQVRQRYGHTPAQWLADGGFASLDHIEQLSARGTTPYVPVPASRNPLIDPHAPKPKDRSAVAEWRKRMDTDEAQAIYKERAASIECTNAQGRRRRLQQFNVCRMSKAKAVLLWHALAHNLMRMAALDIAFAG